MLSTCSNCSTCPTLSTHSRQSVYLFTEYYDQVKKQIRTLAIPIEKKLHKGNSPNLIHRLVRLG